jgi:glycosyltransferase involved in cell wall biosynthesis
MARQTKSLGDSTDWSISITPFGIDTDTFCPNGRNRRDVVKGGGKDRIVVGTVKKLEPKYGVDVLISSFARLRECLADEKPEVADSLRLLIVGDGPQRTELEAFVRDRGLGPVTTFVGAVPHAEVPSYLRTLDVYVAASRSESFGVAVVEASACGRPAVVTNVGGLPEVVRHGETGAVVPCEDPEATATALRRLVLDSELRASMGKVGRRYAIETYEWSACLDRMEKIYQDLVENEGKSLPLQ